MKKSIVSAIMATVIGATTIFGTMPTMAAAPVKQATEAKVGDYCSALATYRKLARQVLHDSRVLYDDYAIGVVMDDNGDVVQFPELCEGKMHYFRYHGFRGEKGKRGNVVMCSYLYDSEGEVASVNYWMLDNGNYNRTAELENDYFTQTGDLPLYAYYRDDPQ